MKKFLLNNYRGIFHIFTFFEFIFWAWVWNLPQMYDLNPQHTLFKLLMVPIIYITAQWTLKISGLERTFEEEKKKLGL